MEEFTSMTHDTYTRGTLEGPFSFSWVSPWKKFVSCVSKG